MQTEVVIVGMTEWVTLGSTGIVEHGYDLSVVESHNQRLQCYFLPNAPSCLIIVNSMPGAVVHQRQ